MVIEKFSKNKTNGFIGYENNEYYINSDSCDFIIKNDSGSIEININDLLEIARHHLYGNLNKNYEVCDLIDLSIRKLTNIQKR